MRIWKEFLSPPIFFRFCFAAHGEKIKAEMTNTNCSYTWLNRSRKWTNFLGKYDDLNNSLFQVEMNGYCCKTNWHKLLDSMSGIMYSIYWKRLFVPTLFCISWAQTVGVCAIIIGVCCVSEVFKKESSHSCYVQHQVNLSPILSMYFQSNQMN